MSLADQIKAASDDDLRDRLVAAAFEAGVPNPTGWVDLNRRALVTAPVAEGDTTNTVMSVYAYAVASYGGRPGQDASKVTDDHLRHAVTSTLDSLQEPSAAPAPTPEVE